MSEMRFDALTYKQRPYLYGPVYSGRIWQILAVRTFRSSMSANGINPCFPQILENDGS